jgi:hypothetical protein
MMAERRNSGTKKAAIARRWCGEHISIATNKHATIEELLEAVFSVRSVPRASKRDQNPKLLVNTCSWWLAVSMEVDVSPPSSD